MRLAGGQSLKKQSSFKFGDGVSLAFEAGLGFLQVPRGILHRARAKRGDAALLDAITAGLLATSHFDCTNGERQVRLCPFIHFNSPTSYSASAPDGDYERLSHRLQRTTYSAVQRVIDEATHTAACEFGVSNGFCLDIGAGNSEQWKLPEHWTLSRLDHVSPLILRNFTLTEDPFLRQDIVLLVHVIVRLVNFENREEGICDYLPAAKQWFAERMLAAVLNRGITGIVVEPELKTRFAPDIVAIL